LAVERPASNLKLADMRLLEKGLHDVCFTKMFASFESSLRLDIQENVTRHPAFIL
jgi:hypothetical protein